ncbi:MAG TPA: hypothetical protein VN181_14470 [Thermoanaerobaculia bacterium]|nr:hypothetical protein [Thermoanaerobaculia bacterium]
MTLERILSFIRSLGIDVHERAMTRDTLVPGIDIDNGALVFEAALLCKPADLLHEAGHIALTEPAKRAQLGGTIESSAAEEVTAIAWTWAAAMHLGIEPADVFHTEVISGNGPTLLENFSSGHYVGVPMLQRWKLAVESEYPRMRRWMRESG